MYSNSLKTLTLALCLSACQSGPFRTEERFPANSPGPAGNEKLRGLDTARAREFDLKFFRSVYEKEGGKNFLMSPTSIRLLLGMAYLGTDTGSASESELAGALGLSTDKAEARQQLQALAKSFLLQGDQLKIESGNIVYAKRPLEQAWINDVTKTFNALVFDDLMLRDKAKIRAMEKRLGVAEGKFNQSPANNMSRYVEKVTNNMIRDFVKEDELSDPLLVAVLVNALYFKGSWNRRFHPSRTLKKMDFEGGGKADYMVRANGKEFTLENGQCVGAEVKESYFENDRVQVLSLPFKKIKVKEKQGNYEYEHEKTIASMVFVLPKKGIALGNVVGGEVSSPGFWAEVERGSRATPMTEIRIPKFKYETEVFDLLAHAQKEELGISGFMKRPEVRQISREIDEITQFAQQAAVKVNEEGAELAAATKMMMATRSMRIEEEPKSFIADRPFAYALLIHESNELAFIGTVKKPEYKMDGEKAYDPASDALRACYSAR